MDSARAQALPDGPEKPRIQRISLHFSTLVYRSKKADSSPSSDLDFPWEEENAAGEASGAGENLYPEESSARKRCHDGMEGRGKCVCQPHFDKRGKV